MEENWYLGSASEVVTRLESDPGKGITQEEAQKRLQKFGENALAETRPRPPWLKFIDQFKSLLVIVLLVAAAFAWIIGDLKDAIVILVVTFFNASLGFYQEHRAEKTLSALKGMLCLSTRVKRDGNVIEIDPVKLVPGDIVLLEAGDKVPADGRIMQAHNVEVSESALTGESQSVGKAGKELKGKDIPLADRTNMLFMNTVLTRGRAEMMVTSTGQATEMGKIAGMISSASEGKTPLQEQLDILGKRLALIAGGVVLIILALDYFRGIPFIEAAMTSIALAVAAVPEGLPAVVTVTLAIGMWRMAKNRAILKKLSSVETLGSTTVICSDKTGTLTMNKMKARTAILAGEEVQIEEGHEMSINKDFLLPMVLSSEASMRHGELIGDPTETALLGLAVKSGIDPEREREKSPRIAEIPFDSEHKFMATFHHNGKFVEMFIKGAPDVLLNRSGHFLSGDEKRDLSPTEKETIEKSNRSLAEKGLRVLAVARLRIPAEEFDPSSDLWQWSEGWTYIGMVGIMDPPRPEAREAISLCHKAGIQVKMITGDHKVTAASIARELGLKGDVVLGSDIDGLKVEELGERTDNISVFARVSPEHKVKIVQALKSRGHVTAMTGDGVNDAPALKTADIGVAMGITGTAVTKEAATLVLTDDNFATIVRAVEEGRVIYDNIVKFVRFQLSTNIGAILTVLISTLFGFANPFTPIQLLWINIIMDGPPAMSLGLEKGRSGLMEIPPRPRREQILTSGRLLRLAYFGFIMMAGTLGVYHVANATGDLEYAKTMAFTTFVLFQFFNVFNAREEFTTAFNQNFFKNWRLWVALAGVLVLQLVVIYWSPAQEVFETKPLSGRDLLLVICVASSVLVLEEVRKIFTHGKKSDKISRPERQVNMRSNQIVKGH